MLRRDILTEHETETARKREGERESSLNKGEGESVVRKGDQ